MGGGRRRKMRTSNIEPKRKRKRSEAGGKREANIEHRTEEEEVGCEGEPRSGAQALHPIINIQYSIPCEAHGKP
jgi:hypothetical protein